MSPTAFLPDIGISQTPRRVGFTETYLFGLFQGSSDSLILNKDIMILKVFFKAKGYVLLNQKIMILNKGTHYWEVQ